MNRVFCLFFNKEKPAARGEEDGRIMAAARDSLMFRFREAVESGCGQSGTWDQLNSAVIESVRRSRSLMFTKDGREIIVDWGKAGQIWGVWRR